MIKKTPLYQCHAKASAQMMEFANTLLPIRFSSEREEHLAVRHRAGLFDISHMGAIFVDGAHAVDFLQYVLTNDISRLIDGQSQYTLMLHEKGGIIDDLIAYRLEEGRFLLCINAANIEEDLRHLREHAAPFGVSIDDASERIAQIAVQGPRALELMREITEDSPPGRHAIGRMNLSGIDVLVARTGYTGEDGCEIFVSATDAETLWEGLLHAGEMVGAIPCGLAARDSLRLEAGLLLHGQDMDTTTSPLEARLMFAVDLAKDSFIGKKAIEERKDRRDQKKLCGFRLADRGIARHGFGVFTTEGNPIGVVTSGGLPPGYPFGIGLAYLASTHTAIGTRIAIDIRGRTVPASVSSHRFLATRSKEDRT